MELSSKEVISALANRMAALVKTSGKEEEVVTKGSSGGESEFEFVSFDSAESIHSSTSDISQYGNTKILNEFALLSAELNAARRALKSKDAEIFGLKARAKDSDNKISTQDKLLKEGGKEILDVKALNLKLDVEKMELQVENEAHRCDAISAQRVFREKIEKSDRKSRDLQAENDKLRLDINFSHTILREKTKQWNDARERLDAREKSSNKDVLRLRAENEKLKVENEKIQEEIEKLKPSISVPRSHLVANTKGVHQRLNMATSWW